MLRVLVTSLRTVLGRWWQQCPQYRDARFARRSLESEAALRTHMYRVHGNRGLARRFVADTQWKSFVTRARAVQHGNSTRCKHTTLNGECVENAPEEQARLDHEMAVFRCNAKRVRLSFLACTKADGSA